MEGAVGVIVRIVATLALVAAVVAVAWNLLAAETDLAQDPAGQIDYPKFTTEASCLAVGGTWGGTPAACSAP